MIIVAHRGGHALGPENTITVMKKSVEAGARALHMDIRCTMEDTPVLMHDATVDRTTNGSGEIYMMLDKNVATLDAGNGLHVPPLAVALETFRQDKTMLFLELKHPATALPVAEMVNHFINKKNIAYQRIVVMTQYHQLIAQIKDKYPKMVTGAMVKKIPESLAACGEYTNSHYIMPPIDLLTPEFMEDAHRRELQVIPYVAETPSQIAHAQKLGVAGIITPDPRLA